LNPNNFFIPPAIASQPACQAERGGQGEALAGRRNFYCVVLLRNMLRNMLRSICPPCLPALGGGGKDYGTSLADLDKYFFQFAVSARLKK